MPYRDGTGPRGTGQNGGMGRGPCGRGNARRGGYGRGLGLGAGAALPAPVSDSAALREENRELKTRLEQLEKRMDESGR